LGYTAGGGGGTAVIVAGSGTESSIRCNVNNIASGNCSAALGGACNLASSNYSVVVSGCCNTSSGYYSFIGTGMCNISSGGTSFIGSGASNTSSGYSSFIGSGRCNISISCFSFTGSGYCNISSSCFSFIGSGICNTASGYYSSVLGGFGNEATAEYSGIYGRNLTNNCACSFMANQLRAENLAEGSICANAGGTIVNDTSDCRLKDCIMCIDYGLYHISCLNPVSFYWNEENKKNGLGRQIGFVAQEVMQFIPEAVFNTKSGHYGLNMNKIVPVLTSAIKEMKSCQDTMNLEIEKLAAIIKKAGLA
jgi:hypothetical protein